MSDLHDVLRSLDFSIDDNFEPQPLRGLSNRNYVVRQNEEMHVVRVACEQAERFGMSREAEGEVLQLASDAGLGAEVVRYALPEGHLITKLLPSEGVGQDPATFETPEMLRRVTEGVKRIHELPAIGHEFAPIGRIREAFRRAEESRASLPDGYKHLLRQLDEVEEYRGPLKPEHTALCHNDLFGGNVLDSDPIRFIDWEFAGMGDIFFDLGTLVVCCDEASPLPEDARSLILETYFGRVEPDHVRRLSDMVFVAQLHVVAWGLTHHVMGTSSQGWEGFTFLGFATDLLEHLMAEITR